MHVFKETFRFYFGPYLFESSYFAGVLIELLKFALIFLRER
jgi:hypothetical protein